MYFSLIILWVATAAAFAFVAYNWRCLKWTGDADYRKKHAGNFFAGLIAFVVCLILALVQTIPF